MTKLKTYLKRHLLWVGMLAVVMPLAIILGLQYQSLVELEETSSLAARAYRNRFLDHVTEEIENTYRSEAERMLNIPASTFTHNDYDKAKYYFKKKYFKGARRLFVADFAEPDGSKVSFYNATFNSFEPSCSSPQQERAVRVACASFEELSRRGTSIRSALTVHEHDSDNRIILNPITDESSKLVGVAGVIVDMWYFKKYFLPKVIQKSLQKFFPGREREHVIVTVYNSDNRLLYASQPIKGQNDEEESTRLPFIFTDWQLGIRNRDMTPEQWAQEHFVINLSLSVLMTLVLIGGVVVALRTASREMKLSRMKADFVSNVSHELRTPLSSIRVFGEFLRLGRVGEADKIREYGQYIETESRRLTQLINNILDFSKIESDRKTYRFETADVGEIIAETLKTFQVRLEQNGFAVSFAGPNEPLSLAVIDSDAVAQAFVNLLDNAVKYSGSAKEIHVRLGQKHGYITISVTDHGIGIPRIEQEKIFDKFHRVSTGLVHDVKGSGLGLSIVNHIVEAHRGKVAVESEPGKGSTFTIHLPVEQNLSDNPETLDAKPMLGDEPSLGLDFKA